MLVISALEGTIFSSNIQRYAAFIGAAIVALGFIPVPLVDPSLPKATWFEWTVALLPLMPIAILALSFVVRREMPVVLAAVCASAIFAAGALITFFLMALSGGGTELVVLHGVSLTLACAACILLVSDVGKRAKSMVLSVCLIPVLVGVWSLASAPLAYANAIEISSNRAFCVGEHSPIEKELGSIIGLRGLSFYTTRSGYKIRDTWYFHGLLLVEGDGEIVVYNWSPRYLEFQAVERPQQLIASPFGSCVPRKEFFQELNLF